jgi:glycosyltransferase involved in cell wall biosynthesis
VESAVGLEEVGEMILVEDKSPDNALGLCKTLVEEYDKVKLFQHPNGENRGAGASRNLGIEKSTCEFIAFLDADDFYLPKRFEREKELFEDPKVDGVYAATGYYFENENKTNSKLTTVDAAFEPSELLLKLLTFKGRFTTDAITVRRDLLNKTGLFDVEMRLHQDMNLWYRFAHFGRLVPGSIDKAVAMRRVHDENRISEKSWNSRAYFHRKNFLYFKNYANVNKRAMQIIINRFIFKNSATKLQVVFHYAKIFLVSPGLSKNYF